MRSTYVLDTTYYTSGETVLETDLPTFAFLKPTTFTARFTGANCLDELIYDEYLEVYWYDKQCEFGSCNA